MRGAWALILVGGCSFTPPSSTVDGDVPDDVPPDVDMGGRVTDGLIGEWRFNDSGGPGGNAITDETTPPVSPTIMDPARVTWLGTSLTINSPVAIQTGTQPNRLLEACAMNNQCTLEVFVTTSSDAQIGIGNPPQPARIISFAPTNASNHHISIGQLNGMWVGQARNANLGVDVHGGPGLMQPVTVGKSTHLAMVVDGTTRVFYVDGTPVMDDLGGMLQGIWGSNRAFVLAGEPGGLGGWIGSFHFAAMYDRALTQAEVIRNRDVGPR